MSSNSSHSKRSQFTRSNATQSFGAKSSGRQSTSSVSSNNSSGISRQFSQTSSDGDCGASGSGNINNNVINGRSSNDKFNRSNSIGSRSSSCSSRSNSKSRSIPSLSSRDSKVSNNRSKSGATCVKNNSKQQCDSSQPTPQLTSGGHQASNSSLVVVERSPRSKSPLSMRVSSFLSNSIQKRTKSSSSIDRVSNVSNASTSTSKYSARKSDTKDKDSHSSSSIMARRDRGAGSGAGVDRVDGRRVSAKWRIDGRKMTSSARKEFEAQEDAKIAALKKPQPGSRQQPMEGLILKFTNVVKGYQYRWLVLDPDSGMLEYFEKEEHKKQRPRGSVHLAAAVVSPSEEDSQTFIVNAANGEIYKLRASDARDRQLWVDRIRSTAEHHTANMTQFPQHSPKLMRTDSFNSQSNRRNDSGRRTRGSMESLPINKRSPRDEAFQEVKEFHLDAEDCLRNLEDKISALSPSGDHINSLDSELLLLKATSAATLRCVQDCISLLQNAEPPKTQSSQSSPRSPLANDQPRLSVTETDGNTDYQANLPKEEEEVLDEEVYEDKDLEGVEEHKSIILHLLSQLKLGMDLTKVVLPTFILERRSLLEMFADCMAHPDAFLKIPDIQDPEGRMLAVLEWYLTSFHNGRKGTIAKKPYNPIIGETFHCSWTLKDNPESSTSHRLSYIAEQVSHHPPISAFYFECPSKKVKINASIYTKSKFMGMSIGVSMVGKVRLRLEEFDEDYVFSLPSAYARSILTVPWVELGDKVSLTCDKTGYQANIIFHTKPFYGGKLHHVTADAKNTKTGESICKVQGQWNGVMDFTFATGDTQSVDVSQLYVTRKSVRPIEKQEEHESRRLWQHVSTALKLNDINTATEHKKGLEELQREGERHRKSMDLPYVGKFFDNIDGTWTHKSLPKIFMQEKKE